MNVGNNEQTTKDGKLLGGVTGKGFMPGVSGNPSGRPKGTLKEYVQKKFIAMSDEEKEKFLDGINSDTQWKMGEGNPHQSQDTDITSGGDKIVFVPPELIKKRGLDK